MNKLYVWISVVFILLLLVILLLISPLICFIAVAALVVAVCVLYRTQPDLFARIFGRRKDNDATPQVLPPLEKPKYEAHLKLVNQSAIHPDPFDVSSPDFTLGRSPECNYQLGSNSRISRVHARIVYDEASGLSYLIDESTYGTTLNGVRLQKGARNSLHNNDTINIENITLTVWNK